MSIDVLKARGFQLESTGGGCTAYIRRDEDGGEIVITSADRDGCAPTNDSEPVLVGVNDHEGASLLLLSFEHVGAFLWTWTGP